MQRSPRPEDRWLFFRTARSRRGFLAICCVQIRALIELYRYPIKIDVLQYDMILTDRERLALPRHFPNLRNHTFAMTRSSPKKNPLEIDIYVPTLIAVVANKMTAGASQKLRATFGIGIVEWRVLTYLAVNQPATGAAVSQSIGIDKAGVSRAASRLHKNGIVAFRRGPGPNLGYVLTAKGQRLHKRVFGLSVARQRALLSGLTKSDVTRLIRYLHILRNNMPAMEQANPPRRKSPRKPKE